MNIHTRPSKIRDGWWFATHPAESLMNHFIKAIPPIISLFSVAGRKHRLLSVLRYPLQTCRKLL
ncbi:hypothetical protein NAI83_10615, partial [Oxalobacter formigenes]|uniref:hypothetical protein n=1 Tax=Oxalobacter formigenes TaxID=847 RepID=UPI001C9E535F